VVNKIVQMNFNDVKRILYDETEYAHRYFEVQNFKGTEEFLGDKDGLKRLNLLFLFLF
jgi:hypothetical protein